MPLGLTNAPATFQYLMNSIFTPYMRKYVLVFMDDILIYNRTLDDHVQCLRLVFQVLLKNELFLKFKKCAFAQQSIEYLVHVISKDVVLIDLNKSEAMLKWHVPNSLTEVRGFLGFTGYYRKFVRKYGIMAKPFTSLPKNKIFSRPKKAEEAFQTLKRAMPSVPVLTLPNFSVPFEIETNACDKGVGAVLTKKGHQLHF
jgi:hypothetical protein